MALAGRVNEQPRARRVVIDVASNRNPHPAPHEYRTTLRSRSRCNTLSETCADAARTRRASFEVRITPQSFARKLLEDVPPARLEGGCVNSLHVLPQGRRSPPSDDLVYVV